LTGSVCMAGYARKQENSVPLLMPNCPGIRVDRNGLDT
jgi:hypothetical protein